MGATTAEVVRRQADGTWRYVIDNVWGDQTASEPSAKQRPKRPRLDAADIVIIGAGAKLVLVPSRFARSPRSSVI